MTSEQVPGLDGPPYVDPVPGEQLPVVGEKSADVPVEPA